MTEVKSQVLMSLVVWDMGSYECLAITYGPSVAFHSAVFDSNRWLLQPSILHLFALRICSSKQCFNLINMIIIVKMHYNPTKDTLVPFNVWGLGLMRTLCQWFWIRWNWEIVADYGRKTMVCFLKIVVSCSWGSIFQSHRRRDRRNCFREFIDSIYSSTPQIMAWASDRCHR